MYLYGLSTSEVAPSQPTSRPFQTINHSNQDCEDMPDYPNLLNNMLQGHRAGNLTEHFKYEMTQEGPQDNVTHIATATFRGITYAVGRGKSKGVAKNAAAQVVYEGFLANGVPGT